MIRLTYWLILVTLTFSSGALIAHENDEQLKVSNIAYLPYAGDFFIRSEWSYENSSSRTEFPAQTLPNSTVWPAASISAPKTQYYTELSLKYGVTDRVALGAAGRYMLLSQTATNYEGGAGLPASTSSENNGFYQPALNISARLLGTRSNEWFVNLEGRFQPGLTNGSPVASPQDSFISILGAGLNAGDFTGMLVLYGGYTSPKTVSGISYNETKISGVQAMLQLDFDDFYLRPIGGFVKFFDAASENNVILRQVQPFIRGELGFPVGESSVLNFAVEQKLPLNATVSTNGLYGTSTYAGTLTLSFSLASVF